MTLQLNIYGDRYDDGEPCFLTIADGRMVFNRVTREWIKWPSLLAKAQAESHVWQPREVGIPSIGWQIANSRLTGQRWAPGLDDTAGLPSEAITNGETFTGATGSTPPTGWSATGLAPDFTLDGSILVITSNGAGNVGMSQDVTVTPGTPMVLEIQTRADTTAWTLTVNGQSLTFPGGARQIAVSIVPAATPVSVMLEGTATGTLALEYVRMYEEAELTGSGSVIVPPQPVPETEVHGPFDYGDQTYFIQSFPASGAECMVWFDVDSDPDPDVKLTLEQVCESGIEDGMKMDIHGKLMMIDACADGLPCVMKSGGLKKAYQKKED